MSCTSQDFVASVQYDIQLQAGVRFDETNMYFIRKIDGVAESLAGWSAECELRDSINGTLRLTLNTDTGGIVLNAVPGSIYIRITHEQTAALALRNDKGVYLLKLINPALEPTWFAWGKVSESRWG